MTAICRLLRVLLLALVAMATGNDTSLLDFDLQPDFDTARAQDGRHHQHPFYDVNFWHTVERLLLHIRPEVITDNGIEMPEADDRPLDQRQRLRQPHGYMHLLYRDAEDQVQTNGTIGVRTIVGLEPVRETTAKESNTTTLTFNLTSTSIQPADVYAVELAFGRSNEMGDHDNDVGRGIQYLNVQVNDDDNDGDDRSPALMKLPVNVRQSTAQHDTTEYYTVQVPTVAFGQWPVGRRERLKSLTVHWTSLHHTITHPLLVLHATTDQTRAAAEHPVRRVRSAHLPPRTCKRCAYAERKRPLGASSTWSSGGNGGMPKTTHNAHHDTCGLRKWYVTLGDLRWDTWVIAPSGIPMDYCSGLCQAPIVDTLKNATNHAVIRSMLLAGHLTDKMPFIPPPYCVPIKLKSTNIMYQESGQFVIKSLDNIIAEQCGCS